MLAGKSAGSGDRVGGHPAESAGLSDAAPLGDMLRDRFDLLGGESSIEERRRFAFGEAGLADVAAEDAFGLVRSTAMGHGQISGPSLAMLGAVFIEAAEARQVVHGEDSIERSTSKKPKAARSIDNRSGAAMQQS